MMTSPEVFSTKNIIIGLLAVSFLGFSSCNPSMAFKPSGVAALSSPSILAARFMKMLPVTGCPLGMSGKSLLKIGLKSREIKLINPPLSPIFMMPNHKESTPVNPMIMFLVLNTSGLVIIPIGIMVYRAQLGAAQPTDVFVPVLLATSIATLSGIIAVSIYQRINLLNRTILLFLGGVSLCIAGLIYGFSTLSRTQMDTLSTTGANVFLFLIIIGFIITGIRKKINVYDAFVEGAKEGFTTAVRIIPYLVAILVGIGVFRASGAMDYLIGGIEKLVNLCGVDSEWVGGLPTAFMKPLSGSGSRGLMVDAMTNYGADSFVGRLTCILQGSTDTTFYILAVYFGSVGISKTRHAVPCGLLADTVGSIAAIFICYLFFG